jgi:hypothetical protein
MVLSIIGLVTGCCSFGIPSLAAIVLGHVAMRATNGGAKAGRGMAIAGLVMGYIMLAPAIVLSVWIVLLGGLGALSGLSPGPATTP